MEQIFKSILIFIAAITVGLIGMLIYLLVDSADIKSTNTVVITVEAKEVIPAHTTFIMSGKVIVPQHHRESYRIQFKIDEKDTTFSVEKNLFDQIEVGKMIEVDYGSGRLSDSIYPTDVRLVPE